MGEVLLKLVTQSNGHRTRQKKKRTEQRLGQNIMKPKLCLALALFSLVVICQAIPEEVDSDVITTNDLARKRTFDSRIRLAKKDFGDLAKKWDSRIRLAKRYMDWDKRIRLAKRSWDSRIRLAKRDGLGLDYEHSTEDTEDRIIPNHQNNELFYYGEK